MTQTEVADDLQFAPGEVVIVRDAEWLVTNTEQTTSGTLVRCIGLSELVRDTTGAFYTDLDTIQRLDTREARVVGDAGLRHRRIAGRDGSCSRPAIGVPLPAFAKPGATQCLHDHPLLHRDKPRRIHRDTRALARLALQARLR